MKLIYKDFKEVERLLLFLTENGFSFSPYSAMHILEQEPDANVVMTLKEWRRAGTHINKNSKPILVPLPVSKKYYIINGSAKPLYSLSISEREKVIQNNEKIEEHIEYHYYKFFSQTSIIGNVDEIFFSSKKILLNISEEIELFKLLEYTINFCFKVEIEIFDVNKYGLNSFYSKDKNKMYVKENTSRELLIAFVDMLLKETSTQSDEIIEFERYLTLFYITDILPVKNIDIRNVEKSFYMCVDKLDFCKSVTRCIKMTKYILSFLNTKEEYNEDDSKKIKEKNLSKFKNLKIN